MNQHEYNLKIYLDRFDIHNIRYMSQCISKKLLKIKDVPKDVPMYYKPVHRHVFSCFI